MSKGSGKITEGGRQIKQVYLYNEKNEEIGDHRDGNTVCSFSGVRKEG